MATLPAPTYLRAVMGEPPAPSMWPVTAHASGRYFVDNTGAPFLINGDTPWSFGVRLLDAEQDTYLDDRQAKGFNALLCYPIEHEFNTTSPAYRNRYGEDPFLTMTNWHQPNPDYWARIVNFVDKAKDRDMLVFMNPAFFGFGGGSQGWSSEINADSDADLYAYGVYLGQTFTQENVHWFFGGDYDGTSGLRAKQAQIVAGLLSEQPDAEITCHPAPNSLSSDVWDKATYPWRTFEWVYCYEKDGTYPYAEVARALAKAEGDPIVFCEGNYEDEFSVSAQAIRRQAYTAILAGACGHYYGHGIVWPFSSGWETALDDTGALEMVHVKALFDAYEWHLLEPRTDNSFVSSAKGSGENIVTPALASDGSFGMAYVPGSQNVTFVMSALTPSSVRVRRYSVTAGTYSTVSGSPFSNSGSQTIASGGECVLVLDAQP